MIEYKIYIIIFIMLVNKIKDKDKDIIINKPLCTHENIGKINYNQRLCINEFAICHLLIFTLSLNKFLKAGKFIIEENFFLQWL